MLEVAEPDFMMDDDLRIFADSVARFLDREAPATRVQKWRDEGCVERDFWTKAGEQGFLGVSVPAEYGGAGGDFRHDVVLIDQVARREVSGFAISLHNGVVAPYVVAHGTEEQKRRWLPRLCNGEMIAAVAMSEPDVGSDLQKMRTTARRDGDGYRINGQKTFITNGQLANFIVVAAKTDPEAGAKGISLLVVDADQANGFRRGRHLDKIGCEAQDTSELFFDDVWVPAENLLGLEEGLGFRQLMTELPRERLVIAIQAQAMIEAALAETIDYVKQRKAFGQPIFDFQNTQFKLAEAKTQATIARVFLNDCLRLVLDGELSGARAAMAKYWITELQGRIIDDCLQMHGAYGYMSEYRIGRMYKDARVSRIYGGANEIMKVLIARSL
ncbi:MAG: acyl-CoA dehydrogenase [Bradyrhizobium sp.]|nr:acyl-CoA dehydrogenase [Bradyrhizobium sp.]